ncbi:MAG: hypothetical protein ACTHMS_09020 [Jatrophihabitans sp.]|uniref:hypothetical protein n=1 Tax=Jatrophihabitans sp. TaxID=1932789 RepID=UPI003F81AA64
MSVTTLAHRILHLPATVLHKVPLGDRVLSTAEHGVQTVEALVLRGRRTAGRAADRATDGRFAPSPTSTDDDRPSRPSATALRDDAPIEVDVQQAEQIADDLLEQEELEPHAGELAEDADLQEVQAALRAKHLLAEQIEDERAEQRHEQVAEQEHAEH